MRLAHHLAAVLLDPENREEARDIFRRLGIQIGLTFGAQKFGPKRFVRRLKGGVVVYGDAKLPRPERSAATAEGASRAPILGPQTVDPFAMALLAAVDKASFCGKVESQRVGMDSDFNTQLFC